MNECVSVYRTYHILSHGGLQFLLLSEIERQLVKAPHFIFDLTYAPNPCMKCRMKLEIDHHTGNYMPYL